MKKEIVVQFTDFNGLIGEPSIKIVTPTIKIKVLISLNGLSMRLNKILPREDWFFLGGT